MSQGPTKPMRSIMRWMADKLPEQSGFRTSVPVWIYHKLLAARDFISVRSSTVQLNSNGLKREWPVESGSFLIGQPGGPVAICTLTSSELPKSLYQVPGVCLAGRLYTANLGIEKLILNIISNPRIRFLLVCGRESSVFLPGQTLTALYDFGVDNDQKIIKAKGHWPVLKNITQQSIDQFRNQVQLIGYIGESDEHELKDKILELVESNPGPRPVSFRDYAAGTEGLMHTFINLQPGGHREPVGYDPKGFFIITMDPMKGEIVIRHYYPDHTPGFEMRGRTGESILLGLIRENLVSQLTHAGYLGAELSKAETALRNHLVYEQDRPLNLNRE